MDSSRGGRGLLCPPLFLGLALFVVSSRGFPEQPASYNGTLPPLIVVEPSKSIVFRVGDRVELPCVATGEPPPFYKWKMNDFDFEPDTDGRVTIQPGVGTLVFSPAIEIDEGIYQCLATNQLGTAVTIKIRLRKAYLEPFLPRPTRRHFPKLGYALTLRCVPPRSFPNSDVYWATTLGGESMTPIELSSRITTDPYGSLHFVNILPEDRRDGKIYACIAHNKVTQTVQQGEYAIIEPQGLTIYKTPPNIMWQSPTHQVALRSDVWRVKCVFSGSPTPRVEWARINGAMPSRAREESFGQELVIEDVQFEDMGRYECQGINDVAQVPIRRSFDLRVESAPYWTRMPESVNASEQDKAEFFCEALGDPSPVFFWFLNGVAISEIPTDPRRVVDKNKITFNNLTMEDAQVIQCNSTNKHGYIWSNAYLNVLAAATTGFKP